MQNPFCFPYPQQHYDRPKQTREILLVRNMNMDSGFTSPRNQTPVHGVRKQDTNKYLLCMHPVAAIAGFLVRLLHNTQPIDHFRSN
jgi:hypothetical protein